MTAVDAESTAKRARAAVRARAIPERNTSAVCEQVQQTCAGRCDGPAPRRDRQKGHVERHYFHEHVLWAGHIHPGRRKAAAARLNQNDYGHPGLLLRSETAVRSLFNSLDGSEIA